jgi:hypothetical protein
VWFNTLIPLREENMKKSNSISCSVGSGLIATMLGVAGIFMPFTVGVRETLSVTAFGSVTTRTADFAGYSLIFGNSDMSGNGGLIAGWSCFLVGLVFVILGLVTNFMGKKNKNLSVFAYGLGGLALLAGSVVFFFALPMLEFTNGSVSISGVSGSVAFKLAVGFLLYSILGIISALLSLFAAIKEAK